MRDRIKIDGFIISGIVVAERLSDNDKNRKCYMHNDPQLDIHFIKDMNANQKN